MDPSFETACAQPQCQNPLQGFGAPRVPVVSCESSWAANATPKHYVCIYVNLRVKYACYRSIYLTSKLSTSCQKQQQQIHIQIVQMTWM